MANVFDQFDAQAESAVAPAAGAATGNVFDQFDIDDPRMAVETPGMLESFARGAVTSGTFGFDDEIGLQDKTKREAARKANPWTFFAGEMVGGAAPMLAAGPVAGAIRAGGVLTDRGARLARGAINLLNPRQATTAAGAVGQAVKTGVTYGALSGAGNADPENTTGVSGEILERAKGAGSGGVVGGLFAGPLGLAGHGVSRVAQHIGGARAAARLETDDARQGALMAMARGFERDRITPEQLVGQIQDEFRGGRTRSRRYGARGNQQAWTDDMIEEAVRLSESGYSAAQIASRLGGPGESAVRTVLSDARTGARGPLNITDRTGMVRTGAGDNTQMTLRAAAATPGEARGIAREALLERQVGAHSRLGEAFDRLIGTRDYDGAAARHTEALQTAGQNAYGAAFRNERPFDLQPIFDRWTRQYDGRRGPVPESVTAGINSMLRERPVRNQVTGATVATELIPPRNIREFIDARQNLTAAIDKATREYGRNSAVTRQLVGLRTELSDHVRATNPQWGIADDIWADGMAAQNALEAGARMSTRLNTRTREGLTEWTEARAALREARQPDPTAVQAAEAVLRTAQHIGDPAGIAAAREGLRLAQAGDPGRIAGAEARMELFRVGLVRALNDALKNENATHDLTKTLRLPAAREMLTEVLGAQRTRELYRVIDAEHAMLRTYGSQFGSQTTPLKAAMEDLDWAPRMSGALDVVNPKKWVELTAEHISKRYNADRNARLMPMMTEEDPLRQLQILRALGGVTQARSEAGEMVNRPIRGMIGPAAGATISENSAGWREQERRRQAVRGMIGEIR